MILFSPVFVVFGLALVGFIMFCQVFSNVLITSVWFSILAGLKIFLDEFWRVFKYFGSLRRDDGAGCGALRGAPSAERRLAAALGTAPRLRILRFLPSASQQNAFPLGLARRNCGS